MWRDLIASLATDVTFAPGATESSIAATEDALAVQFPDQLRSMLLESNGVLGEYDLGLVWSVDRIRDDNLDFRNNRDFADHYMPFEHLLFFCGRWQRRPVRLSHSKR